MAPVVVDVLEVGKTGKPRDFSLMRAKFQRLDDCSKTVALVVCSWSPVVSIYHKWSKEGTVVTKSL